MDGDDLVPQVAARRPPATTRSATSSHIWPGPNFGYRKRSIRLVSTSFCETSPGLPERRADRVPEGLGDGEALHPLRAPLGGDLRARHAPDLLRVVLEERQVQPLAEAIDEEVLEGRLVGARHQSSLQVAGANLPGADEPEVAQRARAQLQRVVEELPPVIDARQAGPDQHASVRGRSSASTRAGMKSRRSFWYAERYRAAALIPSPTGRISCHQFMTQSDLEKNRWPPRSMRLPR